MANVRTKEREILCKYLRQECTATGHVRERETDFTLN